MNSDSFAAIPWQLGKLLSRKHKIYLFVLLLLTILLSLIETAGVSVIMPFISIATNPGLLDTGKYKFFYDALGFTDKNTAVIAFGISIICFFIFKSVYNVAYTYSLTKFSLGTYRNLALRVFKVYFSIPYRVFVQKNTSDIISIVNSETNKVSGLILNCLQMASEAFTALLLYSFMVAVNWQMTLVLTAILLIAILFIVVVLIKKNKKEGEKNSVANMKLNRVLHEAFGNIKFIKLKGNEENFFNRFDVSSHAVSRAQTITNTLQTLPRNILESLGFSLLIGAVIFILWRFHTAERIIPLISMYALALYRILPAVNRMLSNVNNIAYNQPALKRVYDAIHQDIENEGSLPVSFEKSIQIDSISFNYLTGTEVLHNVSIEIDKGDSLAITGESGGGKSTLADIIIGVNKPTSGNLFVDGVKIADENIRSWRSKIGYIPQSIYLFDGTVAENVVFATEFDEERLISALKMANIWQFLETKDGIHTLVGEGGIQLSGGQKQRVGIARALYGNPDVLVLDEATSALDNDTEGKIMDEIYKISKGRTLIVIAHRLTTVERCKKRIMIENGRVVGRSAAKESL
jgi:ATP-binding cassette subfamily B protein/ATP-binding cassette subfamily C protein